ncbi:ParB/RepB/Spo0J family partition protein [Helicobacter sp. 11S02596-1]|uniref:IbrB-like domain-containing protein n=1 Tax=Helicobacter sp. 11S02596-1 TaxID=1476194 RepID=UPI000BA5B6BF|nr:ParB/RepB/Spo0J family partition protein [Helicobacter sp. 11S02596-1]PAF44729.1 chromosome partitioning protein ParB [Helicobacter sp. 11S02596-1]
MPTKDNFQSPVYKVIAVPFEKVRSNTYNPNHIATPEMALLYQSILNDGYTMPIVCYYIADEDKYEIVDGFHRYLIMREHRDIYEREKGRLPVVVIDKDISHRMASTIRHNRARGSHAVELMQKIVAELIECGKSDEWIMKNIGMDADELLRLKQVSGLSSLFASKDFSKSWTI